MRLDYEQESSNIEDRRGIEYAAHLPIRSGTHPDIALHRERISPNRLTGGSRSKRADDGFYFWSKRWEGGLADTTRPERFRQP